jgi:predicted nucleic acid-binding protein
MTRQHTQVLVDTGPLVAVFDRSDQHHAVCLETLKLIHPPMWTTWPVLTEVAWMLRNEPKGLQRLCTGVESGLLRIAELSEAVLAELPAVQKKYASLSLQMADLSLLFVAERDQRTTLFTLDRRDFSVVQRKSRGKLVLLPESLGG